MSLPEVVLWRILKQRPCGVKFRRQHPIGHFVADFYCAAADLVVEIDGIAHDMGDRPFVDERRDTWLSSYGKRVIRIPASQVLSDVHAVAQSLVMAANAAPPLSALRAATSPSGGGSSLRD